MVSIHVAMYSQTVPDLPPLIKEKVPVLKIASQVAMITHVSPSIDTEWNARCSRQLSVHIATSVTSIESNPRCGIAELKESRIAV
jgi:hypothetical protein